MKRCKKRDHYGQFRPVVYSLRQMPVIPENPGAPAKQKEKANFLREIWLLPVRFYRRCISPLFPGVCRFSPTCSAYCMEAVREWGILRGTALAAWRILRCNPFGGKGYDPVPKKKKKQK